MSGRGFWKTSREGSKERQRTTRPLKPSTQQRETPTARELRKRTRMLHRFYSLLLIVKGYRNIPLRLLSVCCFAAIYDSAPLWSPCKHKEYNPLGSAGFRGLSTARLVAAVKAFLPHREWYARETTWKITKGGALRQTGTKGVTYEH